MANRKEILPIARPEDEVIASFGICINCGGVSDLGDGLCLKCFDKNFNKSVKQ